MKTKIIKMENNREKQVKTIEIAASIVKRDGVIVFPTETAYGLGADATSDAAVKKVFELKVRPPEKGIPVIVSDLFMIKEYASLSSIAEHLVKSFTPGPLTLVVDQREGKFPRELSQSGIAFRVPGNDFLRALVSGCETPLTSTSANISGEPPLYKIDEVIKLFDGKVDLILDQGNLPPIFPSTIIDVRGEPKLLRKGPIDEKEVFAEIERFNSSLRKMP
ncbi:threonylcarbamoyl-AMP synthase [Candidatus Micrarchaeota archaeon]|nr:threonylcarbamoyl-AMP synthase [Candidatus Micrarchaeota archaeon]